MFISSLARWVKFGKDLELLDSPGIIPMRISDQTAAIKLAICDDIGERAYDVTDVATILVQMLAKIPSVGCALDIVIIYQTDFSFLMIHSTE